MSLNWIIKVLLLLSVQTSFASPNCTSFFLASKVFTSPSSNHDRSFSFWSDFDLELFRQRRAEFEDTFRSDGKVNLSKNEFDPSTKLAFMEALCQNKGLHFFDFEDLLRRGSGIQKLRLRRLINKLKLEMNSMKIGKLADILEEIYSISLAVRLSKSQTNQFFNFSFEKTLKIQMRKRIELEILNSDLISAFEEFGIIKNQSLVEQLRTWRKNHEVVENRFLSKLLNYISVEYLKYGSSLPEITSGPSQLSKNEIINIIKENGFESVYPLFKKRYQNVTLFNTIWSSARIIFLSFYLSYSSMMIIENLPIFITGVKMATFSTAELLEYQNQTFSIETARLQQFESWKRAFYEFEGRWPDPQRDKDEWDRNWNFIMNSTPNQLKAAF